MEKEDKLDGEGARPTATTYSNSELMEMIESWTLTLQKLCERVESQDKRINDQERMIATLITTNHQQRDRQLQTLPCAVVSQNRQAVLGELEDETMHCGADVESFAAALSRDMDGDVSPSQPSESDSGLIPHGSNPTSNQLFAQWRSSINEEKVTNQKHQEELHNLQPQEHNSSPLELVPHGSNANNQQQQANHPVEHTQLLLQPKQRHDNHLQRQSEQNLPQFTQANNPLAGNRQVPFGLLLPAIRPHLRKDKNMQLDTLFAKLRRNEINKEEFVRLMRNIVGDQMLRVAIKNILQKRQANHAMEHTQLPLQQKQCHDDHLQRQSEQNLPQFSQANVVQISKQKADHFPESDRLRHQHSQSQYPELQKLNNQQPSTGEAANNPLTRNTQVPFGLLLPAIRPHLCKDRAMQLDTLFSELRRNEINKEGFVRLMRSIVGDQMLRVAINEVQVQAARNPQTGPEQYPLQSLTSLKQQKIISSYCANPYSAAPPTAASTTVKLRNQDSQMRQVSLHQSIELAQSGGASQPQNVMNEVKYEMQTSTTGSLSRSTSDSTLQHNSALWQSSLNNEQKISTLPSVTNVKQEVVDPTEDMQPNSQVPTFSFRAQLDQGNTAPSGTLKDDTLEKQSSGIAFSTSITTVQTHSPSGPMGTQVDPSVQTLTPCTTTSFRVATNVKTPPKKPFVAQKKPADARRTSPPKPSKKQKASGAFLDQSIEQSNDVTAVSGVNLREEEEEEQLFSGPKEDRRASEATRMVVQEEEERLILLKDPLQKNLARIMSENGLIKNISSNVEHCLSLCVKERMRRLISILVRSSKQVDGNTGCEGKKDRDESRLKELEAIKYEDDEMWTTDDEMWTTAANIAAQAAGGGDDMPSKWKLMAEQAKQKREGEMDMAQDVNSKSSPTSGRTARKNQDGESRSPSTALVL